MNIKGNSVPCFSKRWSERFSLQIIWSRSQCGEKAWPNISGKTVEESERATATYEWKWGKNLWSLFRTTKMWKNKWCKPHCRVCNPSLKDVLQRLGWKKQKTDGKYCACRRSENVMNQKTHCVLEKVFNSGLRGARCWGILCQRGFLDWCNTALCCLLQPLHWTAFYCICWNYLMRLLGYCKEPIKDLDATNYLDRK